MAGTRVRPLAGPRYKSCAGHPRFFSRTKQVVDGGTSPAMTSDVKRHEVARWNFARGFFVCDFGFGSALCKKSHFQRNYFLLVHEFTFTRAIVSQHSRLGNFLMKRTIFASALALAALGFAPGLTVTASAYDSAGVQGHIDIARIKSVLKLTPEQQHYWPAVESALRGIARQRVQPVEQTEGMISRVSHRVYSFVLDSATIARIGAAARPLVRVLDDRQKQDAIALCHEMGLGQVLAALN
jgi:hypothetical protein